MKDKIIAFFEDVTKEMKRVTWPHQQELRDSTVIIIVVCGVISAFIYGVDLVVNKILTAIM
jgi:preprotein translocase subunit SecE